MLKRLGILIIIYTILGPGSGCKAQSQYSSTITKMENSLFGVDYSSQSDEARLKRIEENVYGSAFSTSISQRIEKLKKDLSADLLGKEIKPKTDTFAEEESYTEAEPKADSNVNYPVVDSMEQKVLGKTYNSTEIKQRLSNLEKNLFKKTYSDDLNSRVERLQTAIRPQVKAYGQDNYEENENNYLSQGATGSAASLLDEFTQNRNYGNDIPQYNRQNSVLDEYQNDPDITIPLASLEKQILKKSFPDDTLTNRLMRLEIKVFNLNFTDDDPQTRLDRVASAHQAKKSAKRYDNNKFSQHAATAMQVGAFLLLILAAIL